MKYIIFMAFILLISGCSTRVKNIGGICHNENWYIDPANNNSRIFRSGTEDYGASAEQKRDRHIVKYFLYDRNYNDSIEIPKNKMWKVKCNGKYWHENLTRAQYMENKKQRYSLENCFDRRNVFLDEDRSKEALEKRRQEVGLTKYQSLFMSTNTKEECIERHKEPMIDDWEDDPFNFVYTKDKNGTYSISFYIGSNCEPYRDFVMIPIEECFEDGWCKILCLTSDSLYVKESVLYK